MPASVLVELAQAHDDRSPERGNNDETPPGCTDTFGTTRPLARRVGPSVLQPRKRATASTTRPGLHRWVIG
jgi:hypothetical protein